MEPTPTHREWLVHTVVDTGLRIEVSGKRTQEELHSNPTQQFRDDDNALLTHVRTLLNTPNLRSIIIQPVEVKGE